MRARVIVFAMCAAACEAASGLDGFEIVQPPAAPSSSSTGGGGMGGLPEGGGGTGATGGGGAGGGGQLLPPCGLSDAFEDAFIDPATWMPEIAINARFREENGVLQLEVDPVIVDSRYTRLVSTMKHSVANCSMQIQIGAGTVGNEANEEFYFAAIHEPSKDR